METATLEPQAKSWCGFHFSNVITDRLIKLALVTLLRGILLVNYVQKFLDYLDYKNWTTMSIRSDNEKQSSFKLLQGLYLFLEMANMKNIDWPLYIR